MERKRREGETAFLGSIPRSNSSPALLFLPLSPVLTLR
jgi:hypothetical protein